MTTFRSGTYLIIILWLVFWTGARDLTLAAPGESHEAMSPAPTMTGSCAAPPPTTAPMVAPGPSYTTLNCGEVRIDSRAAGQQSGLGAAYLGMST